MPPDNWRTLNLSLQPAEYERLKQHASDMQTGISRLARMILKHYMEQFEKPEEKKDDE